MQRAGAPGARACARHGGGADGAGARGSVQEAGGCGGAMGKRAGAMAAALL